MCWHLKSLPFLAWGKKTKIGKFSQPSDDFFFFSLLLFENKLLFCVELLKEISSIKIKKEKAKKERKGKIYYGVLSYGICQNNEIK